VWSYLPLPHHVVVRGSRAHRPAWCEIDCPPDIYTLSTRFGTKRSFGTVSNQQYHYFGSSSFSSRLENTRIKATCYFSLRIHSPVVALKINMPASVQYLSTPPASFDYDSDPIAAMTSYSRMMHSHTQQQMDAATRAARRRSPPAADDRHIPNGLSKQSTHSTSSSRSSF
jgi:hypothetical protein